MGAIRKIARGVARNRMKQNGYMQFCKHDKGSDSQFSKVWRKVVGWDAGIPKAG